eukprot:1395468-Amorphochlora_amoeboformis.AAC.2
MNKVDALKGMPDSKASSEAKDVCVDGKADLEKSVINSEPDLIAGKLIAEKKVLPNGSLVAEKETPKEKPPPTTPKGKLGTPNQNRKKQTPQSSKKRSNAAKSSANTPASAKKKAKKHADSDDDMYSFSSEDFSDESSSSDDVEEMGIPEWFKDGKLHKPKGLMRPDDDNVVECKPLQIIEEHHVKTRRATLNQSVGEAFLRSKPNRDRFICGHLDLFTPFLIDMSRKRWYDKLVEITDAMEFKSTDGNTVKSRTKPTKVMTEGEKE